MIFMTWIVPCNLKYYDVEGAFQTLKTVDWKQKVATVQKDDTVLIYISSPVRAILYNCTVVKTNKKESTIDDSTFVIKGDTYKDYGCYMELSLVKKYDQEFLNAKRMEELGVKGRLMGQRCAPEELIAYLDRQEDVN